MRLAIQGEYGSFSHEAAVKLQPQATVVPCALSAHVFRLVQSGEVDGAVIPIENSLAGSVLEHFDLLFQTGVTIERELLLRIRHNLIACPGDRLDAIGPVLSHPIALAQCREFFVRHAGMTPTPFYDTAGSVKHVVSHELRGTGAIASELAAQIYGGDVLSAGIEDNAANFTRFFLIRGPETIQPAANADKVSIAFIVANQPGTLVGALQRLAEQGANLCKIESRPVPGRPWEYVFYVDYLIAGAAANEQALAALREQCSVVKEFGRYQAAPSLT